MKILIVGIIFAIILFPISLADGFEWNSLLIWEELQYIPVAIISDFDIEDEKIQTIKKVIESKKQHNQEFQIDKTDLEILKCYRILCVLLNNIQ